MIHCHPRAIARMSAVSALVQYILAATLEIVLVRFSKDIILKDVAHLDEETLRETETPLARTRRAVWEILYTDDAVVISRFHEGLARMMTVIVRVSGASG